MAMEMTPGQGIVKSERCGPIIWKALCIKGVMAVISRHSELLTGSTLRFSDTLTNEECVARKYLRFWMKR